MNRIKTGDLVQVITGGADKGKQGKVLKVFRSENKVLVEGVRLVKRHQKANQQGGPAGIVEKAQKIAISNVMPVDPKTRKPSRVRFEVKKDGKKTIKQRLCIKSGQAVETVEAKA